MSCDRHSILSKMFLIPFLCVISSGMLSAGIMNCRIDGDCPPNHYCYNMTNVCAECRPNFCSLYHRLDSWRKCHTAPSECGSCLPGYEEEEFSDGSKRGACILSHQPTPSQALGYQNAVEGPSSAPTYLIGFIGFSLVLLVGFFMYRTVHHPTIHIIRHEETELKPINNQQTNPRNHEVLNNSEVYDPSAPILPEYSRVDPYRNCENDSCGNAPDCYEHKVELKCEPIHSLLLESAVFRRPNYEEENGDNATNVQDEEDEEDVDSQEAEEDTNRSNCLIPPVHYHDESTLPSTWTPEPLQAEVESASLPTNPEASKRPRTDLASSESEDEQNPKRNCNNGNEDEEARPSGLFHNFRATFAWLNQNTTANNNTQNRNPESPPSKDK